MNKNNSDLTYDIIRKKNQYNIKDDFKEALRSKWIIDLNTGNEYQIASFENDYVYLAGKNKFFSLAELFKNYIFTGYFLIIGV